MPDNIKFGKVAHTALCDEDDGKEIDQVLHAYFGEGTKELECFLEWCDTNGFHTIVKLYRKET